ncbi:Cytochrome c oxidase subunit 4 [Mortierella sp. 14UC]|nr:Cytochrome c oxidase subunit 4 [Mortierella sp. 14UC]
MFAVRAVRASSSVRAIIVRPATAVRVARFSACATRFGPGAAPGTTPTDVNQSTGLERAELLGKMEGKDIFDLAPLEVHVRGTKANPTLIRSRDPIRYVGCSGVPGEHHEVQWLLIDQSHEFDRCDQCGNVYKWSAYEPDENFPDPAGLHHH